MDITEMNVNQSRKREIKAALNAVLAVASAIQELGQVPSGTLYAQVCAVLPEPHFTRVLDTLKNTGLVTESPAHILTWAGPAKPTVTPNSQN